MCIYVCMCCREIEPLCHKKLCVVEGIVLQDERYCVVLKRMQQCEVMCDTCCMSVVQSCVIVTSAIKCLGISISCHSLYSSM